MRITLSQLKKLAVETKSGTKLGRVYDLVFEVEGQSVAQYFVKSSVVSMNIGMDKYLISRSQVLSINDKKMVVEDSVKKIESDEEVERGGVDVRPATMREES